MNEERLQEIKDSIDFQRKTLIALNMQTLCVDEEMELYNEIIRLQQENQQLKENYERIYNENCKLREEHNITDISLLDENQQLKKQKIDVIEYIKNNKLFKYVYDEEELFEIITDKQAKEDLLRMLGETDVED